MPPTSKPSTSTAPPLEAKETSQKMLAYARPHWRIFLVALLLFTAGAAVEPLIPALFKRLIDSGFKEGMNYPLWAVPVVIISLFFVRGMFTFAGTYVMASAMSLVVLNLRRDLMEALLHADARIFSKMSPGIAVTRIINDPQSASQTLGNTLISVIKDVTTLLFLIAYLVYLNWQLTLLSFISMPLLGVVLKLIQGRLRHVGQAQYEAQKRLVNTVDDNARAWRVVRTFGARDLELERFDREAATFRRMNIKQAAASSLVTPLSQVIAAIGISIIITLAIYQASRGSTTVGEFVSFITALLMTVSPMRHLTDVYQPFTSAMLSLRGAFNLIKAPAEPDLGTRELPESQGDIKFDNVSLRYLGSATNALSGFDLHILPGQTVAFVGSSGAGKTTVANALLRFATPSSGTISLDGVPIQDLKLRSLRKHFAVVSQDIILFDGSIAENVSYASASGVDRARVEQCLRAANLWDHVHGMPQGMDSGIGTNGSRLSGGQRQRLAIARAIYRNASVWIFDEATSALDSESEAVVQRSIESLRGSKTMILIAHRLSTIRKADVICVMSNGGVLEKGSHAELMAQGGMYARMVQIQSSS